MRKNLLCATLLGLLPLTAWSVNSFSLIEGEFPITGTSPNGRYAVGHDPNYCDASMVYMQSFLYDADSQTLEWITRWDENDPAIGGQFKDVSDAGLIFGTAKDTDHEVTWVDPMFGDSFTGYTAVAAIWNHDALTKLPYGELDIDGFARQEDGTFGVAISGDGNTAIGYAAYDNMATILPLMWQRGSDGDWSLTMLPIPDGVKFPKLCDISGDGHVIVGSARLNDDDVVVCWEDGVATVIPGPEKARPDEFINIQPLAISHNGRFLALSVNFQASIYDMETGEYHAVKPWTEFSQISQTVAIDNEGNLYGNYSGYPDSRPFVYLFADKKIVDMGYYLDLAVPGFGESARFAKGSRMCFVSVSPDGHRFLGNTSPWGGQGWIMDIDPQQVIIPDLPVISYAFSRSASSVTLRWGADRNTYGEYSLSHYNIYLDNENVAVADAITDEMEITLEQQPEGYPTYMIEAIYTDNDGQTLASPMSDPVKVAVTTDFSLPLKECFDNSLETNYWTTTSDYGNAGDTNQTIFYQAGVENGSGLYSTISSREPYSFSLVSHALDARGESSVKASFGFIYALLNDMSQTLSNDYVSLEVSTDSGDTWTVAGKWSLSELSAGNYCFKMLDISDFVAGNIFWMRIHREGDGSGMYISGTDNVFVTVSDSLEAPEGVMGVKNADGSLALSWQSPSGAYNLNHLGNLRTMNMSFGNSGEEMICANRFTPEDLAPYKDKYISSVSALINYFNYQEDVKGIHATAVILVDGEIVREQEFEDIAYNDYNVAYLDEPLQIDATKEMMVGILLHDYDEWQWPAVAAVADDYVPGKTDLYTEDNGKTWLRLSDLYDVEDIQGHCLWDISAHISDTPETVDIDYSLMPFIYTAYRNDDILNVVAIDGNATRFRDNSPLDHASYRVSMQSKDGENSAMSAPFEFSSDGVCMLTGEKADIRYDASTRILSGDNDILRISLYNTDGRLMASAESNELSLNGVPSGLYVVALTYADRMLSAKIIVK